MPVRVAPGSDNQLRCRDRERFRQLLKQQDRWISRPALEVRDIGPVNPRLERKLFLGPAVLRA